MNCAARHYLLMDQTNVSLRQYTVPPKTAATAASSDTVAGASPINTVLHVLLSF